MRGNRIRIESLLHSNHAFHFLNWSTQQSIGQDDNNLAVDFVRKKLKEASNEINAEKKVTQHNADPMMKDSRKLKLESEWSKIKIKNDAVKQAMVLKRKIDEADLLELEKRLKMSSKCDLFCRLIWSEIEKSRKQKFEAWLDRDIRCSLK